MTDWTVGELVGDRVVSVRGEESLRRAAEVMEVESIGALLVENAHGTLGIITERDLVRAIAEGLDPEEERVEDAMSTSLVLVEPGAAPMEALARMQEGEIRHLVVWDDRAADVGVVSMRRLLEAIVADSDVGSAV